MILADLRLLAEDTEAPPDGDEFAATRNPIFWAVRFVGLLNARFASFPRSGSYSLMSSNCCSGDQETRMVYFIHNANEQGSRRREKKKEVREEEVGGRRNDVPEILFSSLYRTRAGWRRLPTTTLIFACACVMVRFWARSLGRCISDPCIYKPKRRNKHGDR